MTVITIYPKNGASPLATKMAVPVEVARSYVYDCYAEVMDETEIAAGDWRATLVKK